MKPYIALLISMLAAVCTGIIGFETLENALLNLHFQIRGKRDLHKSIVNVTIEDKSFFNYISGKNKIFPDNQIMSGILQLFLLEHRILHRVARKTATISAAPYCGYPCFSLHKRRSPLMQINGFSKAKTPLSLRANTGFVERAS